MIDPTELRIGNYVDIIQHEGAKPKIHKVYQLRFNYEVSINIDGTLYDPKRIDPIKLNKECLESIGMNLENEAYNLFPFILVENEEGFWLMDGNFYVNRIPLKNLHKLQNLYFELTGKELLNKEIRIGLA
jgi:hypothetical protein